MSKLSGNGGAKRYNYRGSEFYFQSVMHVTPDTTSLTPNPLHKEGEEHKPVPSTTPTLPIVPGVKGAAEKHSGPMSPTSPTSPISPSARGRKAQILEGMSSVPIKMSAEKVKSALDSHPDQGLNWREDQAHKKVDTSTLMPACGKATILASPKDPGRPKPSTELESPVHFPPVSVETSLSPSPSAALPDPLLRSPMITPVSSRWQSQSRQTELDDEELSIAALGHGRALPWNPLHWLEVRQQLIDDGKIKDLPLLMKSVRASSSRALKMEEYLLTESQSIDLSLHLMPAESVRWFGRRNVTVPQMPAGLQTGIIEPPMICVDLSPLDIVQQLQHLNREEQRPIYVVIEVSNFEKDGSLNLGNTRATSMAQQNVLVRTDFNRFASSVSEGFRGAQTNVRDHLTAQYDPYVFTCPNMTMFRGSRDDGYPFMETPMHIQTIVCSMPSTRPAVTISHSFGTSEKTEWYMSDVDQTALLERLSLIGFAALQDTDPDKKAILVLSALGCADRGLHPKDAVANSLKHWRTRFARLFHTVFLACGPDKELAEHFDLAINRQIYGALLTEDISNLADWHWSRSHLAMHVNSMDFALLSDMVREEKDELEEQKRLKEMEELAQKQWEEEEKEMRIAEERERQKMAKEDKYSISPDDAQDLDTSLAQFSPERQQSPPEDDSLTSQTLDRSISQCSMARSEADAEDDGQGKNKELMKHATLIDEYAALQDVKSQAKAPTNMSREAREQALLDRQVELLYKDSRQRGCIQTKKIRSPEDALKPHNRAGGSRSGSMVLEAGRLRAMSCLGLESRRGSARSRSNSVTNTPASRSPSESACGSPASRNRSASMCATPRQRAASVCSPRGRSGSVCGPEAVSRDNSRDPLKRSSSLQAPSDAGSDGSDGSMKSCASRSSRLSTSTEFRGVRSSCVSFFEDPEKRASRTGSTMSLLSQGASPVRRMSMADKVEMKKRESRLSRTTLTGEKNRFGGSVSLAGGLTPTRSSKKELTEAQRLDQVRQEARKRLSSTRVPVDKKDSNQPSTSSSTRSSVGVTPMVHQAPSLPIGPAHTFAASDDGDSATAEEEDDPHKEPEAPLKPFSPVKTKTSVLETSFSKGQVEKVHLTVVELPKFDHVSSSPNVSRRESASSSLDGESTPRSSAKGSRNSSQQQPPELATRSDDNQRSAISSDAAAAISEAENAALSSLLDDADVVLGTVELSRLYTAPASTAPRYDSEEVTIETLEGHESSLISGIGSGLSAERRAADDDISTSEGDVLPAGYVLSIPTNIEVSATSSGSPKSPLMDPTTWANLGHTTLTPIMDDPLSRGASFISSNASNLSTPRGSQNPSPAPSAASGYIPEGARIHHRTSVTIHPVSEEWRVRMDVQELASIYKQHAEVFWANPRRRRVPLKNPHSVRKPGGRSSDEIRSVENIKALEAAAGADKGEREAQAAVMSAVAHSSASNRPVPAGERHCWQRTSLFGCSELEHQLHWGKTEKIEGESTSPSQFSRLHRLLEGTPSTASEEEKDLPPVKALKKKESSVLRRYSDMHTSQLNHVFFRKDSEGKSDVGRESASGVPVSPHAVKAVQSNGGWGAVARASIKRTPGRRISGSRYQSAGPILEELSKNAVDDTHKLADIGDAQPIFL